MHEKPTVILVVDDKEGTRYTVCRLLRREGYEIVEATGGEQALKLARDRPDLIILDIKLPDLDGYEVCRRLKAAPETASIPVLHLSAYMVESESRSTGLESGADGYLTHPVEPRELAAQVRALLRIRRAERQARDQEELFRVTLSSIGDAVISTDNQGRIRFLNPVAASLCGWDAAEAVGRPLIEVFDIVDETSGEPALDPVARVLRDGRVTGLVNHTILISRDGTQRPIEDSASPIRGDDGTPLGVVLVFRDITERRKADADVRSARERLRLTMESVREYAIFTMDMAGVVDSWNTGAELVFGYSKDQIIGQDGRILWTPEDRAVGAPDWEMATAVADGQAQDERWHLKRDGGRFFASGILTIVRDHAGRPMGYTKVARDVTARKLADEALRDQDRRKNEFLAMLAHELRNPLAPISNALRIIRIEDPAAYASARQAWEMIERQVEHMVRLVDDLLDVSRISHGQIKLQPADVDLAAVLFRAVESSRPLIDARRHDLVVRLADRPLPLYADPVRTAQVFWNLLNNAAKYTPEGGRITLSAEVVEPGPGGVSAGVVVRVRDTGMGIPHEMLPRVFDLFTQVEHSIDRSEGGLGIGLTLVRRLTEMQGGTVDATSPGPGLGSEFSVRLPLSARPTSASTPSANHAPEPDAPSPSRRILVVDDIRDSADSLSKLLRLFGNDVRTSYEGQQAIMTAETYMPDVVLLDLGLPGMNGYEVAAGLRKIPSLAGATLVALTGFGTEEDRRQTEAAGFDHHLVKPVDIDALRTLLDRVPGRD
ncbi:response regulator [Isosphaeraceae bacterium EP7]